MKVEKSIKAISLKSIITYILMFVFALSIMGRVLYIQTYEGEELRRKGKKRSTKSFKTAPLRGNIYSSNNSLLAVTIPKYEIRLDMISHKSDGFFNANIDSLAYKLSKLFKDRSKNTYKKLLIRARQKKNYYLLVKRNVTHNQLTQLKKFPILYLGRNKGGLIVIKSTKRELPYKNLAKRTIGIYNKEKGEYLVGLEGAFNETLKGTYGSRLMQKIDGGIWMPIDPANEIKPQNGNDIVTTIDIDIQDITQNALLKQMEARKADYGCVIVMEVATGEIKAIANLGKDKYGHYTENYNHAIGTTSEPGSTFKLASMLVALENNNIQLSDSIDTNNGSVSYYGKTIRDDHKIGNGVISVRDIIEQSSNVGIAKLISKYYDNQPQKYIDGLYNIGLHKKINIPIKGEASPFIKNTDNKSWSGLSLPWIAYGYEILITPLQTLTFYNAIANNGTMMKPLFVKSINNNIKTIETYEPIIIKDRIASKETITKLQSMLEGVVLRGTAKNLKNPYYNIAGKTGTAQIAMGKKGHSAYHHRASFVGYFPAENPKYSCIVLISNPTVGLHYGNVVAGSVFKYISDRIYSTHVDMNSKQEEKLRVSTPAIYYKAGASSDYQEIFNEIHQNPQIDIGSEYVICIPQGDSTHYSTRNIKQSKIPKVIGMTAKDATYILEDLGLNVKLQGRGFVKKQSIPSGSVLKKGKTITLNLSAS